MPRWYAKWDARALAEGWLLSECDFIERDDSNPRFADDNGALEHVRREARKGSPMHATALYYHEQPDDGNHRA